MNDKSSSPPKHVLFYKLANSHCVFVTTVPVRGEIKCFVQITMEFIVTKRNTYTELFVYHGVPLPKLIVFQSIFPLFRWSISVIYISVKDKGKCLTNGFFFGPSLQTTFLDKMYSMPIRMEITKFYT